MESQVQSEIAFESPVLTHPARKSRRKAPPANRSPRLAAAARPAALLCLLGALLTLRGAWAPPASASLRDGTSDGSCRGAIAQAMRRYMLPDGLLDAIAVTESGRPDPVRGRREPWPWTVNAEGQGRFFDSKNDAIAAVQDLQSRGVQSIDVGCLQVNLMHHPDAFASLDQAFDPDANADYAARFLLGLYTRYSNWMGAAMAYHSTTPELGQPYGARVAAEWGSQADLATPLYLESAVPLQRGAVTMANITQPVAPYDPATAYPVPLPSAFKAAMPAPRPHRHASVTVPAKTTRTKAAAKKS